MNTQIILDEYKEITSQIKELEEEKDKLRRQIADIMHQYKTNEIILEDSSGLKWKCAYQKKKNKKVHYQLLMEYIGPEKYPEVVSTNESTSLIISKAPKKDQKEESDEKLRKKPVEDNFSIPTGVIT